MFMIDYLPANYKVPIEISSIFQITNNVYYVLHVTILVLSLCIMLLGLKNIKKDRRILYLLVNIFIGFIVFAIYTILSFYNISTDSI